MRTTLTTATCTDRCWSAKGKICRCSCGGANHGIAYEGLFEKPRTVEEFLDEALARHYHAVKARDGESFGRNGVSKRTSILVKATRRTLDAARSSMARTWKPDPNQMELGLPEEDPFERPDNELSGKGI